MKIGYEASDCPIHDRTYYGGLVDRLKQEFGNNFEPFQCADFNDLVKLDGKYDLIICKTRLPAQIIADHCRKTKSFVIDHGPIHSNRTYIHWCRAHFEVFSSPTLQRAYESTGFKPLIKGYSGGYFLTNLLDTGHPDPDACLVYLIPWEGSRANSETAIPFSEGDTLALLQGLSQLFERVYVVNHVCEAKENFVIRNRADLPQNVLAVTNGPEFHRLVCNVSAVIFEYSSVFAIALWNPEVRLFYRCPARPYGPVSPHNEIFHDIMNEVCYPIIGNEVSAAEFNSDQKKHHRIRAKKLIYDETIADPCDAIIAAVDDAMVLISKPY